MASVAGSIPVASSIKSLTRGGEVVSRQPHKLEVAGSNPACATNPITPIKAGERFYDRRTVGETAEVRNVVKPVGPFAIANPGETRQDQFSRQA